MLNDQFGKECAYSKIPKTLILWRAYILRNSVPVLLEEHVKNIHWQPDHLSYLECKFSIAFQISWHHPPFISVYLNISFAVCFYAVHKTPLAEMQREDEASLLISQVF